MRWPACLSSAVTWTALTCWKPWRGTRRAEAVRRSARTVRRCTLVLGAVTLAGGAARLHRCGDAGADDQRLRPRRSRATAPIAVRFFAPVREAVRLRLDLSCRRGSARRRPRAPPPGTGGPVLSCSAVSVMRSTSPWSARRRTRASTAPPGGAAAVSSTARSSPAVDAAPARRGAPGQQLEQQDAEPIDVFGQRRTPRPGPVRRGVLGAPVGRPACSAPASSGEIWIEEPGDAEVEEPGAAVGLDEAVGRLEIAVNDQLRVGELHRPRHLHEQPEPGREIKPAGVAVAGDRDPVHVLQHEVGTAIVQTAGVEDRGDGRVHQPRQRVALDPEVAHRFRGSDSRAEAP